MERKKAYMYTRVSTIMQVDGYSLDAQEEEIRRYCEYHKIDIVGSYSDKGKSGSTIVGREQFQKMLDDIEGNKEGTPMSSFTSSVGLDGTHMILTVHWAFFGITM